VSPSTGLPAPRGGDVPLAELSAHLGAQVRVGGAVARVDGALVVLADSSGSATLQLVGRAAPLAASLMPGDLVNASGTVTGGGSAQPRLVVDDPAALERVHAPITSGTPSAVAPWSVTGYQPPASHEIAAAQPPSNAPILAFVAIVGLCLVLVLGAFAVKVGWANRLLRRVRPI
jgi:hypothetical protein